MYKIYEVLPDDIVILPLHECDQMKHIQHSQPSWWPKPFYIYFSTLLRDPPYKQQLSLDIQLICNQKHLAFLYKKTSWFLLMEMTDPDFG